VHFFHRAARRLASVCAAVIALSACGGGGGSSSPAPQPVAVATATPTPTPTAAPAAATAFDCPTSDTVVTAANASTLRGDQRMMPRTSQLADIAPAAAQLVAVTYDARTLASSRSILAAREARLGAALTREYAFRHTGLATRVLTMPAGRVAAVEAALRATAGVRSVGRTGTRRYPSSVTAPYFPADPYFAGFAATAVPSGGGTPPPATFGVGPLYESSVVPGQWDMHVTRLEYAFAYSQPNNGSGLTDPAALGSAAVKLAIIDTGEDSTHPELGSKIAYQRCFITSPTNVASQSDFSTDEDGHGTDVAGIAGAATGNGLGFSAAGGNVQLYAYRVFPTPDDSCAKPASKDPQCGSSTLDIASAIDDAVARGVNVISLSLGGSACVDGADADPTEGAAVAEAIAANIVVVAATGNSKGQPVDSPACDPSVIAVGATGIADGTPNGTLPAGGSPSAPYEYVAGYSQYGSPGAAPASAAAWGIVAPGGDPSGVNDSDDVHWIENIWTTTPFKVSASDVSFAGNCSGDYPTETGPADCRVLIAGTSMATPHVAGAAALVISVNPAYQSPAAMKELLCSTAADIADPHEGCGRLDVYRAVATAVGDPNVPASNPIP
jgi:hypothetical protein